MTQATLGIPVLDLVIIVVYMLGILAIGVLSARGIKRTASGYFLADRSLRWGVVGSAMFAANISTIHLVGLAASGYSEGLVWGNFEWMAAFSLILLCLVFAPFYFRSRISTLPEFLEKRFGPGSRIMLAFMAILAALFIHIGMSLYAGAAVFRQFFGIDVVTSIVLISIVTGIYTLLGGLKAVVVTESIQSVILILGAALVTIFAVLALPSHGIASLAAFKAAVKPGQLSMLQTHSSAGLNWYAVFLGYPILGIWYWCTDQTIVQRVLGSRTEKDAQHGALFAGLLKILPVFILVFPGVVGYVLFRDIIGSDANQTLPVLLVKLIPTGLKGVIAAGLLAALMSTIAAALNSTATLVAVDIVKRLRPESSDRTQVRIGRICTVAVMLLAMAWSTQGGRYSSIFEAINTIGSYLAPPITAVFLWGVFWKRGTKQAALTTLIGGFLLGLASFLIDFPVFGAEKVITQGLGIPFMMQAWWMFCICSATFVAVSLLTPAPDREKIAELTWSSPKAVLARGRIQGWSDPRVLAGGLLALLVVLYYIFR
ncbi:MAG TPA: sodium:solute symporter [Candidatus Aminicenantes bacterium]|nr:sodium:solute symporter [Candidatus Aminicenantes bacterium]HRY64587.1 sodium:solute symporter [Candidatus Aminicenantes bacterium]HRZ71500.1 sodium:solute symporter [Candidatus Aminicenantes bacterium]